MYYTSPVGKAEIELGVNNELKTLSISSKTSEIIKIKGG